jgi:hypothetical protein
MSRQSKAAADRETAERLAAVMALGKDDTPTEPVDGRPAEPGSIGYQLLGPGAVDTTPARLDGQTKATDFTVATIVQNLAGMAEIHRRLELLAYEARVVIALGEDLSAAKHLLAENQPVSAEIIGRIRRRAEAWELQHHPVSRREDGGS